MRTIPTSDTQLAANPNRSAYWRLLVNDEGSPAQEWDLTDWRGWNWCESFTLDDTAERTSAQLSVSLRREIGELSLCPGVTSYANTDDDGAAADVLKEARLVVLEVQLCPSGELPNPNGTWHELFRGRIDTIDAGNADQPFLTLGCRDLFCEEEDTFIEGTSEVEDQYPLTAGDDVEEVMQDLLDDNVVTPRTPKVLYVPSSPGWIPNPFLQAKQPLAQALRALSDQLGWTVRYKWDNGTSAFRLTFFEPDRAGGGYVVAFSTADFARVDSASRDLASVRNVVQVWYTDATNGERLRVTRPSPATSTSITAYGRRTMIIAEASTSNINSSTEAVALAEAALADLAEPLWTFSVTLAGLYPYIEVHDAIRLSGSTRWFGTSIDCTVLAIRHSATPEGDATVLTCVQQESGVRSRQYPPTLWQNREAGRGRAPWPSARLNPSAVDALLQKSTGQTITGSTKTKVQLDAILFDRGGNWSGASDYWYTAPFAGLYTLSATVPLEDVTVGEEIDVSIEDTSDNVYAGTRFVVPTTLSGGDVAAAAVEATVFLAAGAKVALYVKHDPGGSYDIPAKGTNPGAAARLHIQGRWLRPTF